MCSSDLLDKGHINLRAVQLFKKKQKVPQALYLQGFETLLTNAADRNRTGTGV